MNSRACRTAVGSYDDKVFGAVERVQKHVALPDPHRPVERLRRIIAKQAILASGPLDFGRNGIPGVMMAGAMHSYLRRQAVTPAPVP